jgi:hypothetical protein
VKRSRAIRLVLTGSLAGAGLVGCSPDQPEVTSDNVYTNNHYVSGAGYYHAPYQGWYPHPYNHYIPGQGYYHGGSWTRNPAAHTTTASRPTAQAAQLASAQHQNATRSRFGTTRGGFGGSSRSGIS